MADRQVRARKRWSITGFRIDPFRKTVIVFESRLERSWLVVFIVDVEIVEIREQQKVRYLRDGVWRYRFIDFVLIYADGSRRFVEIRYDNQASDEYRQRLQEDSRYFMNKKRGDRAEVLTEIDLKSASFQSALAIYRSAMKQPRTRWIPRR